MTFHERLGLSGVYVGGAFYNRIASLEIIHIAVMAVEGHDLSNRAIRVLAQSRIPSERLITETFHTSVD